MAMGHASKRKACRPSVIPLQSQFCVRATQARLYYLFLGALKTTKNKCAKLRSHGYPRVLFWGLGPQNRAPDGPAISVFIFKVEICSAISVLIAR